jgi:hypothetical protein
MANRLITPDEFARGTLQIMRDHAAKLPEGKRERFYRACASWLSGGVYR